MIEITKEPNSDSRTAKPGFKKEDLKESTKAHIGHVNEGMKFFAEMLITTAKKHDNTKLSNFDDFFEALNSGRVKESLWYQKHITEERHHLVANVPNDITLVDVFEHLVDCVVAGMSRSGQVYDVDLSSEVLQLAHKNTVELLKKNIKVIDNSKDDDILDTEIPKKSKE